MGEKSVPDPGFAGDHGEVDERLADALAGWAAGAEPGGVHAALVEARLLVPVVAVSDATERGTSEERERTSSTDMALVTIRGADGRTALPAFTSLAALAAWNPDARPVPVEAAKAALATLAEAADLLVLDAAGPVTFRVEGAALRALARGRVPVPAREDPEVRAALRALLTPEDEIAAACLLPSADGADAVLGLIIVARTDIHAVVGRLADALAADPVLRERLDRGLDIAVLPATADLGAAPTVLERRDPGRGLLG